MLNNKIGPGRQRSAQSRSVIRLRGTTDVLHIMKSIAWQISDGARTQPWLTSDVVQKGGDNLPPARTGQNVPAWPLIWVRIILGFGPSFSKSCIVQPRYGPSFSKSVIFQVLHFPVLQSPGPPPTHFALPFPHFCRLLKHFCLFQGEHTPCPCLLEPLVLLNNSWEVPRRHAASHPCVSRWSFIVCTLINSV